MGEQPEQWQLQEERGWRKRGKEGRERSGGSAEGTKM